jgi:hypothetical protein
MNGSLMASVSGREQRGSLVDAEAAHAARWCDVVRFHYAAGLHLANTRQRFKQAQHLDAGNRLVVIDCVERRGQRQIARGEAGFQLGSLDTYCGGFHQGSGSLFVTQRRWRWHADNASRPPWSRLGLVMQVILFDFFGTLVEYSASRVAQGFERSWLLMVQADCRLGYDDWLVAWDTCFGALDDHAEITGLEFSMHDVAASFAQSGAVRP